MVSGWREVVASETRAAAQIGMLANPTARWVSSTLAPMQSKRGVMGYVGAVAGLTSAGCHVMKWPPAHWESCLFGFSRESS